MRTIILVLSFLFFLPGLSCSQNGFGNQWIFGRIIDPPPASTILNFNDNTLKIESIDIPMEFEGACAVMCDSAGKLLFYSNGCYISNAAHEMMVNGDSIGKGKLETSFCKTGGNPLTQGIIALPKPGSDHLYYLFYTDIAAPYNMQPFFPLAPITLFYSVIDMALQNGQGAVVEKNKVIIQDTFALSMMQAERHANGKDWWVIMPKSHSNCYWTLRFTENGIDTVFKQCIGPTWIENDPQGQAVFSPNSTYYVRSNFFYGLNLFNFNNSTGMFYNPVNISLGQDTFYFNGAVFSPNSRFIYSPAYGKLWQFDTWANDISASRVLIGALNTPPNIQSKTYFNQARLAPDGKIYIGGTGGFKYLHIISRPNCLGQECDLLQYGIEMAGRSNYTMPNMPHYKHWNETDTCETVSTIIIRNIPNTIRFYPNPTQQFLMAEGLEIGDRVDIFDISGRVAMARIFNRERIDVSSLNNGFYIIKINREEHELGWFKIIKQ